MKAYLVLCGGAVFEGERIGAARDSVGELVFTTGSIGYLETLTDPSYGEHGTQPRAEPDCSVLQRSA